jgi:diguanylate cyclase (GGDEF)-like protein
MPAGSGLAAPPRALPAAGARRTVAVVGLRRATAFVLLCGLTTALDGEAAAWLAGLGAVAFACCGGVGCLRASRRTTGGARAGWTALAVASWSWAAGHAVGLATAGVLDRSGRYPAPDDVAGLAFPIVALVAVCLLAPRSPDRALSRRLLDALTVACALTLAAWVVVLSSFVAGADPGSDLPAGSLAAMVVWLARPVGDAILLTVVVLTVAQDRTLPWRWGLLACAMLAMAASDGAYAVLQAGGGSPYATVVGWGWWAAFCLLTTAGATVGRAEESGGLRRPPGPAPRAPRPGLLPYLPLAVAAGAVAVEYDRGRSLDAVGTALAVLLVALVLVRQYCLLRDNYRLAGAVAEREAQLHHLAFHDALTGLANRALFLDRLGHALDLANRGARAVSVVFVDLDGFKAVNDTLGHAAGDQLLIAVARRMRGAIRASDTLARLGGDEFAVLVEQGSDATVVARTLLATLRRPFTLDGRQVSVSASIGVATADPGLGAEQAPALVHRADIAMYAVKTSGKGGVAAHREVPAPSRVIPAQHRALVGALERGAARVVFRPVVDVGHGRVAALEVLGRWTDPEPGSGPPRAAPAPASALLEPACRQLAAWNAVLGHHRLRLLVAVALSELDDPELPVRVDRVLARHRLSPGQLTLEIDGGALPDRSAGALEALHRLRHLGVRLGLGGLGSGYATLAWLSGAPLDTVRIDRELIADIDHDPARCRLLRGVLALTRQLGLRTVADGVERTGQLLELRRLGCDLVLGHLVAGPATAAELTPVVLAQQPLLPRGLLVPAPTPTTSAVGAG